MQLMSPINPADTPQKDPRKNTTTTPWRRINWPILVQLLNRKTRPWRWYVAVKNGHKHLQVVSPHGTHWDFKLSGGAWIRPAPRPPLPTPAAPDP